MTFRASCTNIRSMPVACALAPRFRLLTALEGRAEQLRAPAALAPEPGAAQLIGEVSEPAERLGVRPGMRLGEALSRCPELALVPPDPERAERAWETALRRLEGIGAEVESERAGRGLLRGGRAARALGRHRGRAGQGARARPGCRCGWPPRRCASAPTRLRSRMEARARPRWSPAERRAGSSPRCRSRCCSGRLAEGGRPAQRAGAARHRHPRPARGPAPRRGRRPLRRLWACGRCGWPAARTSRCARGAPHEALAVELELPEAGSGQQLERALELLIDRLLAHPERRGQIGAGAAALGAARGRRRLAAAVALRTAATERERLLLALRAPARAASRARPRCCAWRRSALGPAAGEQLSLASPEEQRRRRISARRCARRGRPAGREAVLRVLEVDPDSRVPERREAADALPGGAGPLMKGRLNQPWPVPVQVGADGRPRAVGRLAVERGARGMAGRGRLVDAPAAAAALLRAGAGGRQRRRRLLRAGGGRWFRQRA